MPGLEFKELTDKMNKAVTIAKKLSSQLHLLTKKYNTLSVKFKELVRENQRIKFENQKLTQDLKAAKDRAIWSDNSE